MPPRRTKLLIVLVVTLAYRASSNMLQTSVPLYAKFVLGQSDFTISVIVALAELAAITSLLYLAYSEIGVGRSILVSLAFTSPTIPIFLVAQSVVALTLVNIFVNFWIGTLMPLLLTTVVLISSRTFYACRPLFDADGEKIESDHVIEPSMRFVSGKPETIDYAPPTKCFPWVTLHQSDD